MWVCWLVAGGEWLICCWWGCRCGSVGKGCLEWLRCSYLLAFFVCANFRLLASGSSVVGGVGVTEAVDMLV